MIIQLEIIHSLIYYSMIEKTYFNEVLECFRRFGDGCDGGNGGDNDNGGEELKTKRKIFNKYAVFVPTMQKLKN